MPDYRITKDGSGYTLTEDTGTDPKTCLFCCLGLFIVSTIAYILVLFAGIDNHANMFSVLAIPAGIPIEIVIEMLHSVPFLEWLPSANLLQSLLP